MLSNSVIACRIASTVKSESAKVSPIRNRSGCAAASPYSELRAYAETSTALSVGMTNDFMQLTKTIDQSTGLPLAAFGSLS
jgi:hypothetical protein